MSANAGTGIKYDVTRSYANLFDEPDVQAPRLGTMFFDALNEKWFKFVKNLNASAGVIGDFMCWVISSADNTDINIPATGRLNMMAGVLMSAFGGTALPFGWIQCKGLGKGNVTSSASHAAGTSLKVTNAGGVSAVFDAAVDTGPVFGSSALMTTTFNPGGAAVTDVILRCTMLE